MILDIYIVSLIPNEVLLAFAAMGVLLIALFMPEW